VKTKLLLVSIVVTTRKYKAYLARKDQEVEMEARSKRRQVFIQKKAAHRPGIR
jgi:hypothetical protein